MKPLRIALLILVLAPVLPAAETFPGLKSVLTPEEWQRAGLDRLSPDELGVIDAALIRHHGQAAANHQVEINTMRETTARGVAEQKRGWLERFGLPVFGDDDWRNMPPLRAKVVAWETRNRFRLDNGQVWEGIQPITYDLLNRDIEIHARPSQQFALYLDGKNTTLRVIRLR